MNIWYDVEFILVFLMSLLVVRKRRAKNPKSYINQMEIHIEHERDRNKRALFQRNYITPDPGSILNLIKYSVMCTLALLLCMLCVSPSRWIVLQEHNSQAELLRLKSFPRNATYEG